MHRYFSNNRHILIDGETSTGTPVRPHNWPERFAGTLATYGSNRRLMFSDAIAPVMVDGVKCLRLERSLAQSQPELFREVLGFAAHHGLKVHGMAAELQDLPSAA